MAWVYPNKWRMAYDWSYPNIPKQLRVITTQTCPNSFTTVSTPSADMPSNCTLLSDFWGGMGVGGRLEWQHLPTSSQVMCQQDTASQGHTAPQGRRMGEPRMQNELWQIPGASEPACRHVHTHTDSEDPTQPLSVPVWISKDGQLKQSMSQEAAVIKHDREIFFMIRVPRIVTHC